MTMPTSDPREQFAAFIAALFQPDDIVEVRAIDCRELSDGTTKLAPTQAWGSAKNLHLTFPSLAASNAEGRAIYIGANPRTKKGGAKAEDVALARAFFVDFDGGVTPEQARARIISVRLPVPSIVVNSGHGTHAYWLLAEPMTDLALWTRYQKSLIALLDTDKAINDRSRIMRAPGFLNNKRLPHIPATLVSVTDVRYGLDQFPEPLCPQPTASPSGTKSQTTAARVAGMGNTNTQPGPENLSRTTLYFLNFGAVEGKRNRALFHAACDYYGNGFTQAEADRDLGSRARQCGLSDDEIATTIASAYSRARGPARPVGCAAPQDATNGTDPSASVGSAPPSGSSVGAAAGEDAENWPEPQPLPASLPPVLPFDPDLLPAAIRPWIVDIADRVQCPIDFPAVSVMVAMSSVVGRRVCIRPKCFDDWTVIPNLWGGVIGRPGVMKTPAIQEPLNPLKRLEILAKKKYDEELKEAKAASIVGEEQKKATAKEIRKNLNNPDEAMRLARETLSESEGLAPRRRYIVNDSTVEKLGELLRENPNGFLIYRDELVGLLKSLDKEGQEGARTFYLESWNGNGRYTYDRIARGTVDIEAAVTSIIGAIQPGPLSQYMRGTAREGASDDGLVQRFQLLVQPDISKEWTNVDRWPDSVARKTAFEVFDGLDHLEPMLVQADTDPMDATGIPFLRFTPDAQVMFDAWRTKLEFKVRSGDLHPAIESHLAKYRSLIPSLALLVHLANGNSGPVGIDSLDRAIRWGVYLESHAYRIYSQAIHPDLAAAKTLAKKLLAHELTTGFALRDVYRKGWSGLATAQDALGAVDLLRDWDWLKEVREQTAGRTATTYYINPRIYDLTATKNSDPPSEGTDRTDGSPPSDPSGGSVSDDSEGWPEITPEGKEGSQ